MTYRDTLTTLSTSSEQAVLELYRRLEAGQLTEDEFVEMVAVVIERSNARAVSLADLALAAAITVALRRAVPTLGLSPRGERDRLRKAAGTLVAVLPTTADPVARVARLGRAEPLTTAQRAYSEGVARSPHVAGWTRGLSGKPCQLCQWWHRGGKVWPKSHPMPTHKGCTCTQVPTMKERAA